MKKKLLIDLVIFLLMFLLMFYSLTGSLWHEILGILVFILFIIHLILNRQIVTSLGTKIMKGENVPSKVAYGFILDVIMGIVLIILMVSSILISREIFTFNLVGVWVSIHEISAYILFGGIIIHILFHLKMLGHFLSKKIGMSVSVVETLLILLVGIMTFFVYKNIFIKEKATNDSDTTKIKQTTNNNNNNNSNDNSSSNDNSGGTTPTLQEFLSSRNCSACHNHCPLSMIRCGRGEADKEAATEEYYETYSSSETTTETASNNNDIEYEGVTYTITQNN